VVTTSNLFFRDQLGFILSSIGELEMSEPTYHGTDWIFLFDPRQRDVRLYENTKRQWYGVLYGARLMPYQHIADYKLFKALENFDWDDECFPSVP